MDLNFDGGRVSVLRGTGAGAFRAGVTYEIPRPPGWTQDSSDRTGIAATDLNGDPTATPGPISSPPSFTLLAKTRGAIRVWLTRRNGSLTVHVRMRSILDRARRRGKRLSDRLRTFAPTRS
jgi:hypothetical protein